MVIVSSKNAVQKRTKMKEESSQKAFLAYIIPTMLIRVLFCTACNCLSTVSTEVSKA